MCAEHKKPAKLLKHLATINAKAEEAQLRNLPRVLVFANRIKVGVKRAAAMNLLCFVHGMQLGSTPWEEMGAPAMPLVVLARADGALPVRHAEEGGVQGGHAAR